MALENRANAENVRENENSAGISNDNSDSETVLKRDKARFKSYFTRSKNKLIFLIDKRKSPGHEEIEEACDRLDSAMESVMDTYRTYIFKARKQEIARELSLKLRGLKKNLHRRMKQRDGSWIHRKNNQVKHRKY